MEDINKIKSVPNIDSDKYRIEYCTLTEDECGQYSCKTCPIAIEEYIEQHTEKMNMNLIFRRYDDYMDVNQTNVVARCKSLTKAFDYLTSNTKVKKEDYTLLTKWKRDKINAEYPKLTDVIHGLHIEPPIRMYYANGFPLISVHRGIVLLTAPRITTD